MPLRSTVTTTTTTNDEVKPEDDVHKKSFLSIPDYLHREKLREQGDLLDPMIQWYSLVARPIPRKEWSTLSKAQQAVDQEWAKLRADNGQGPTWDEASVKEAWQVRNDAIRNQESIHFGTLFDICVGNTPNLKKQSANTMEESSSAVTTYVTSSALKLSSLDKDLVRAS